jgi:hypothetical protein
MAAQILANDGTFQLRFVPSRKRYVAGCHTFTREEAIAHWGTRVKTGKCNCHSACIIYLSATELKRARLFLKAIKKHAAEQSQ